MSTHSVVAVYVQCHYSVLTFSKLFRYHGGMDEQESTRQHTAALNMRLKPEQLDLFRRAAEHAGLSLSGWIRERLLRAAREELGEGTMLRDQDSR